MQSQFNYNTHKTLDINHTNVGDIVLFGQYPQYLDESELVPIEWMVIQKEPTRQELTLLSLFALDNLQYNREYTEIDWASSDIRKWLNGLDEFAGKGFIDIAFDETQKCNIISTTLTGNDINSQNSYNCIETVDKIYLLNTAEVQNLLTTDIVKKCKGTEYAKIIKKKRMVANEGIGLWTEVGNCWWWLRNRGQGNTALAAYVLPSGEIVPYGNSVRLGEYGIRPACKISTQFC